MSLRAMIYARVSDKGAKDGYGMDHEGKSGRLEKP